MELPPLEVGDFPFKMSLSVFIQNIKSNIVTIFDFILLTLCTCFHMFLITNKHMQNVLLQIGANKFSGYLSS